jgi:hypothetical protein
MGWIRKIKKHRDRSGQFKRTIQKNKKERMEERKRRDFFMYMEVPILMCSSSIGNALVRLSLRRTHSNGDLPYKKIIGTWYKASFLQKEPGNFPETSQKPSSQN